MDKKLGLRIMTLRIAKGISKKQVANQIGVTLKKYIFIEYGLVKITYDILSKIAKVLGVKVDEITMILDKPLEPEENHSSYNSMKEMFDMLDLFYANKHLYQKLKTSLQTTGS